MTTLTLLRTENPTATESRVRHSALAVALSAIWEAEVQSGRRMMDLSARTGDARTRARLIVLAAFCRAHASKLHARLAALGRGPLPVPSEPGALAGDLAATLRSEAGFARSLVERYKVVAEMARERADLSSAWVCEVNRSEEQDRARELLALAEGDLRPIQPPGESDDA